MAWRHGYAALPLFSIPYFSIGFYPPLGGKEVVIVREMDGFGIEMEDFFLVHPLNG